MINIVKSFVAYVGIEPTELPFYTEILLITNGLNNPYF